MTDADAREYSLHTLSQYCAGYSRGLDDNPLYGTHHPRPHPDRPTPSWLEGYEDGITESEKP